MRVLIAGCGFVGGRLAARLSARGDEVFALRRGAGAPPAPGPGPIRPLRADLVRAEGLSAIPRDPDAVVYLLSAGARQEEAYRAAYVTGLERLLDHLGSVAPGRLVFASSTAVYAQQDGSEVDESSATEPSHFSGRVLLEGEAVARAAGGVALRFGGIYGPGRRSLIDRVARGEAHYAPGPPRYTNRIHVEDCAGSILHLLGLDSVHRLGMDSAHRLGTGSGIESPPAGDVYLGVDEHPAPEREVYEWLAGQLGAPPPTAAPVDPSSRRGSANRRASSRKLRRSGYVFRFKSYREGYAAMLAEGGEGPAVATFRRQ